MGDLQNQTLNDTYNQRNYRAEASSMAIIIYCTIAINIAVFAFICNVGVIVIVVKVRRMQTFTNWLILNLAVSDVIFAMVAIPFEVPLELNNGVWQFPSFSCKLLYPMETALVYSSVLTLVVLSLSRYWAIVHPYRSQPSIFYAKMLILIIWFSSMVVTIPYALALQYSSNSEMCEETWSYKASLIYTLTTFFFQYCLPLIIILSSYGLIIYDLNCSKVSQHKDENSTKKINRSYSSKTKQSETNRVVKLLVILSVTFALCLLPYHIITIYQIINPDVSILRYIYDISFLILYANSALNPIIYNTFNENFRKSLKEFFRNKNKHFSSTYNSTEKSRGTTIEECDQYTSNQEEVKKRNSLLS